MKRLFNRKQAQDSSPEQTPPLSNSPAPAPPTSSQLPPPPQQQQGYGLPPPPRVQNVGNAIGWSVAMPTFDFPYILALSDHLSSSAQASKDAAKALRTEFKHGAPMAQERAIRLMGILMRNTDHRFREQVASKKFLTELTELVSNKRTDPKVKEMVYRVLSPLAHDYQHDSDLKSLTQTFNKLLSTPSTALTSFPSSLDPSSPSYRLNGAPLAPEDELFTPTGLLPSSNRSGRPHRSSRRVRGDRDEEVPKEIEKLQMKELGERADKAKGLARLLNESIVFAGNDKDLERDEMIQEFQTQCLEEQNTLGDNIVWAQVQAEKSRELVNSNPSTSDPTPAHEETEEERGARARMSSNNPFAEVIGSGGGRASVERKTEEEEILEKMLSAHSAIQDSLSLLASRVSSHRQDRQHASDLEAATALSKTYVRGGDGITGGGNYGEGGSKQRWDSVEEREAAQAEEMRREEEELDRIERERGQQSSNQNQNGFGGGEGFLGRPVAENHSQGGYNNHNDSIYGNTASSNNQSTTTTASPYDGLGALESLQGLDFSTPSSPPPAQPQSQSQAPSFPSSNPYANLSLSTSSNEPAQRDPFSESPISSSFLPPQPSEKALGKLRRISTTGRSMDEESSEERQRVLEEQLREKYRRNQEERDQGNGGIREV